MSPYLWRSLETLLNKEKQALLLGDYDLLAQTLPVKEHLLQKLETSTKPPPAHLTKLSRRLNHHQNLITAAMNGLNKKRSILPQHSTYTEKGARKETPPTERKIEKRF